MKTNLTLYKIFCLILAAAVVCGCGVIPAYAAPAAMNAPSAASSAVEARNTDELLAAIAPGATIVLTGEMYSLSDASDYGKDVNSDYYYWEEVYDGYQLVITDVQGLSLIGAENPLISADPRYANVIAFENCDSIYLENFTAGHSTEPGYCAGGVIYLRDCSMVSIKRCSLYGCGILGIDAIGCNGLSVIECDIYECSYGAVQLNSCKDAVFESCTMRDCGNEEDLYFSVINAMYSDNVYILNSSIYNNKCAGLLSENHSKCVFLAGCSIENNLFINVFDSNATDTYIINCEFRANDFGSYYAGVPVCMDAEGNRLKDDDFGAMSRETAKLSELKSIEPPTPENPLPANRSGYYVTTVDEFLAAIAPDRTIILAPGVFDLSTASSYVTPDSGYYYWNDCWDGPELVISDVSNLAIFYSANTLEDAKNCTIAAVPRYANVLRFENCDHIVLSGFTAGHTQEPGECSGGVLDFYCCSDVYIDMCRMYGCGTVGITTQQCEEFTVANCEIYECSYSGASIWSSKNITFDSNIIRDIRADEMLSVGGSKNVIWNGLQLAEGNYRIEDGEPVEIVYDYGFDDGFYGDYPEYDFPKYSISLTVNGEAFPENFELKLSEGESVQLSAKCDNPDSAGENLSWFCIYGGITLNPSEDGSECTLKLEKGPSSPVLVMVKQGKINLYFAVSAK